MKAWWKIGDKPRGLYRPLLSWGISFSSSRDAEVQSLGIRREIAYCFRGGVEPHPSCEERRVLAFFPAERLHSYTYYKAADYHPVGSSGSCNSCPGRNDEGGWYRHDLNEELLWKCRLPWRPGARPDYSDFIVPVRDFLRKCYEKLELRLAEARESAPSDEWFMEEELDSFSWRTENGLDVAERKLRVIRK